MDSTNRVELECGHRIAVADGKLTTWCPACNELVLVR